MVESKVSISSAVIIPDEAPISPRAAKRRQSSTSDTGSKRPRLSTSGSAESPSTLQSSPKAIKVEESNSRPDASSERRKSHVQEERKRGQRLFGGIVNTLSQSSASGQQKRRLEIEKRQQERARLQKAEDEGRKAEKLAKLNEVRKREQIKFDEKSMRIRHSNILAMAQFLTTKTEPKLYYKPWELLAEDKERIKKQIVDTEALIELEVQEFKARHDSKEDPGATEQEETNSASTTKEKTVGEPRITDESSPSVPLSTDAQAPATTNVQAPPDHQQDKSDEQELERETIKAKAESLELHNGEVVVEAEEDTVIY